MKRYYIKKGNAGIIAFNKNRTKSNLQRFIEHTRVDIFTDCIIWTAKTDGKGYGQISLTSGTNMAHRIFYELFIGPIPDEHDIDHTCVNRSCVNPEHLEAVLHSVNIKRIYERNPITHCKRNHEFTPENTYVDKRGKRTCKICRTMHNVLHKNNLTSSLLQKN